VSLYHHRFSILAEPTLRAGSAPTDAAKLHPWNKKHVRVAKKLKSRIHTNPTPPQQ
jgi:hypothetical protein